MQYNICTEMIKSRAKQHCQFVSLNLEDVLRFFIAPLLLRPQRYFKIFDYIFLW